MLIFWLWYLIIASSSKYFGKHTTTKTKQKNPNSIQKAFFWKKTAVLNNAEVLPGNYEV